MKKTALITGGTGFIGTYLAKALLKKGWKIKIVDLKYSNDPFLIKNCEIYKIDITKLKFNHTCFDGVNVIFHLAALPSISRKSKKIFLNNNLNGTRNIIKCAKKRAIKKIIYTSSSTVYGIPKKAILDEKDAGNTIAFYGDSKWKAEKLLINSTKKNFNVNILRPRVVIGPGRLGIFGLLFKRILNNKNIYLIGNGSNYFQFTNVNDFVDACIKCIKLNKNIILNIGSKDRISTYNLLKSLIKKNKSKSNIIKTPSLIIKKVLKILEFFGVSPLTKEQYAIADKNFYLSTEKAESTIKWKSKISTLATLNESYKWFKKNSKKNNQTKEIGILTIFNNFQQSGFQK
ncbi:NAD(P)-dependent oxidoreductase [Candidatus Pelagibacter sp.]|nr:NAD(P)-dependent oxidoreductase [Candidatus Pelagibacter sp.]